MRKAKDTVEGKEPVLTRRVADQRAPETGGASGSGIPRDAAGTAIIRNEVGGSSGSGIPRDAAGRAI